MATTTHLRKRHRFSRPVRILIAWIPAIVGICCIIGESTEAFSANATSRPFRLLWQFIFGADSDARWSIVHHIIRKTGHFFGYGTLGLLFYRAWYRTAEILHRRTFRIENIIYALACTLLVAGSDEWHQHYLPGRIGTPQDVLLDMIGACILQLAFWAIMFIIGKLRHRPDFETV
jgi:VanZ family protein